MFPKLIEFKPDIILLSAGFDAHYKDLINCGFGCITEYDYEWFTNSVLSIAHSYCNDRIISILEGGYNVNGRGISPFASSVSSHVRALQRDYNKPYQSNEFLPIKIIKNTNDDLPSRNLRKRKLNENIEDNPQKKQEI